MPKTPSTLHLNTHARTKLVGSPTTTSSPRFQRGHSSRSNSSLEQQTPVLEDVVAEDWPLRLLEAYQSPAFCLQVLDSESVLLQPVWQNDRWESLCDGRKSLEDVIDAEGVELMVDWILGRKRRSPPHSNNTSDNERELERLDTIRMEEGKNGDMDESRSEPGPSSSTGRSAHNPTTPPSALDSLFGATTINVQLHNPPISLELVKMIYHTATPSNSAYAIIQTILRPTPPDHSVSPSGSLFVRPSGTIASASNTSVATAGYARSNPPHVPFPPPSALPPTRISAQTTPTGAGGSFETTHRERKAQSTSGGSVTNSAHTGPGNSGAQDYFSTSHSLIASGSPGTLPLRHTAPSDPLSVDYILANMNFSKTPLGSKDRWPAELRMALSLILSSKSQATLWWGKDLCLLYNQAYAENISTKHPRIYGMSGPVAYSEVWGELGKAAKEVWSGKAMSEDNEMFLFKTGRGEELEEQYHSWHWSPIYSELPGSKRTKEVLGLLNTTTNTTARVLADRRANVLHDLRDLLGKAREPAQFDEALIEGLSRESRDLPFAIFYHLTTQDGESSTRGSRVSTMDEDRSAASSSAPVGVKLKLGGSVAAFEPAKEICLEFRKTVAGYGPLISPMDDEDEDMEVDTPALRDWPFKAALASRQTVFVEDCRSLTTGFATGHWGILPHSAIVVPICVESDDQIPFGVLVLGLNPRSPYNDDYRNFMHSIRLQIYAGLTQQRADRVQRLEERAEEAEHRRAIAEAEKRSQELLTDVVSHEIRNPLSALSQCCQLVNGNLSVFQSELSTSFAASRPVIPTSEMLNSFEESLDALESIQACATTLASISNDILLLGRLQSDGLLPITSTPTDVIQQARQTVNIFNQSAKMNDIVLTCKIHPSVNAHSVLDIDGKRLTQVLTNLISNASKFVVGRPTRAITLSLGLSTHTPGPTTCEMPDTPMPDHLSIGSPIYLYCSVRDTGPGLHAEDISKLFQKFSQAAHQSLAGGSGMGLYIARLITETLGGRIECVSELGQGCTFRFFVKSTVARFPSPKLNRTQVHFASPEVNTRQPHILVVEDEPINLRILQRSLTRARMTCEVATNGLEALTRLREVNALGSSGKHFDLCLSDLSMPVMNGTDMVKALRQDEASGAVVGRQIVFAITGNARDAQVQAALDAGMDDVILKPYKLSDLLDKIRATISESTG